MTKSENVFASRECAGVEAGSSVPHKTSRGDLYSICLANDSKSQYSEQKH